MIKPFATPCIASRQLLVRNNSTAEILQILLNHATAMEGFITKPTTSLLTLRKP